MLVSLLFLVGGYPALAQNRPEDPWEAGRFRIGPVSFSPTFAIKNMGWDNNVFNELENPKGDFTVTPGVSVRWSLRVGDLRLLGSDSADYLYYAHYASERGLSHRHELRTEYRLNHLRPYALGSYASIKDRVGYEIDTRARHTETALGVGLLVLSGSKTEVDLVGRQTTYRFEGDPIYNDTNIAENLNRKGTIGSATLRYRATALTRLTLLGEFSRDRFDSSAQRDNSSFRMMPGVEFDPFALITGTARVGYRQINMTAPTIPDFSGLVADVNLQYVLLGRTRFSVAVQRDIQYSYDIKVPYYLLTGVMASVRQELGMGWDIEARASNQRLEYRQARSGAGESVPGPVDRVQSYGAGIGYRVSQGSRIGANVDYYQRRSDYQRAYHTIRWGVTTTYEF